MIGPYINNIEAGEVIHTLFLQPEAIVRWIAPREDVYGYWALEGKLQNNTLHISSFLNDHLPEEKIIVANQATILSYANKIFEGSRPLSEFEGNVLAQTLDRLAKRNPTRPNRK